ncbi:MAG TPA: glycerophosphodiester phosphodiesterase family protein [Pseudonocardiaceae bacterium]|jgi:glycerophosphoryl diester phosphodiesterase
MNEVTVVAHRGMAAGCPENTIAALRHSVSLGFPVIEIDLRPTADGHIVIMHDDTVDRTTDGTGEVARMTLAEIRSLDAGRHAGLRFAGERVPTYAEALHVPGTTLILDVKSGDTEQIVRLTERHGAIRNVIAASRSGTDLRDFARIPGLRTLGLVPGPESDPPDPAVLDEFARTGAEFIRLWPRWIMAAPELVERLHRLGKQVWATADTGYGDISPEHPDDDLSELVRLGVDGIVTDLPDVLRDVLAAGTS